ncbi:hypothetical protein GDO86_020075 [Hymenochirus boettgeri]|uniref:Uncharacterized protein n=1 Tax=Hymenochirus boettgeri TaxID=247094 RepID=A0A8T2IFC4_9PIPI|nr:hypothetical protein GDO86_020075 [Hymenochirus boettgeri]
MLWLYPPVFLGPFSLFSCPTLCIQISISFWPKDKAGLPTIFSLNSLSYSFHAVPPYVVNVSNIEYAYLAMFTHCSGYSDVMHAV